MEGCMTRPEIEWEKVKDWYEAKFTGKSLMANLCKLCLAASIYHLWKLRNDLCHGNTPRTEEVVVKNIRWEVQSRVMVKGRFKRSAQNEKLAKLWKFEFLGLVFVSSLFSIVGCGLLLVLLSWFSLCV
jgi:superfamily II helicase